MEFSEKSEHPSEKEEKAPQKLIGESNHIKELLRQIESAAKNDSTVLIQGDSGTGKELVAERIHDDSKRTGRFIPVNCAGIPDTLLESEFFGHEKGSFTGAMSRKEGFFAAANKGTIFLDEIGDLSLSGQTKILRVLQDKRFTRLGNSNQIHVDVRVICATNKNLRQRIEKKEFREDLFSRLSQFMIYTEPLKDRPEDIVLLLQDFTHFVDPKIRFWLYAFDYPEGNVRELKSLYNKNREYIRNELLRSWASRNIADEDGEKEILSIRSRSDLTWFLRRYSLVPELVRQLVSDAKMEIEGIPRYFYDFPFQLEAIFYPEWYADDIEKIVTAYEIIVLRNRTNLTKENIPKRLHIKTERSSPNGFKEYFGLNLPEKNDLYLDADPLKIFPDFTYYWNKFKGKDHHNLIHPVPDKKYGTETIKMLDPRNGKVVFYEYDEGGHLFRVHG